MAAAVSRVAAGGAAPGFPAQRVAEVVRWDGIAVEGVRIHYSVGQAAGKAAADWPCEAGEEDEIPDEFDDARAHEFGRGRPVENVCALQPMHNLQSQHSHNPNLVKQFGELSVSFKAWRPVRGDGNCYYRAVLFSWLERSVALGNLDSLRSFDSMLRPHRQSPLLAASVRTCHNVLRGWIRKRAACTSKAALRALLGEVANEFNKERSDRALILCLRHLIAEYLRQHAHEPVAMGAMGASMDRGDMLTYESWAMAISGAKNIDDYCEQHVYVMNKDAADHVQHVCPRVLRTAVRICMVDRETARCNFIDYGEGSLMATRPGAGESVGSAAQLASIGGHFGVQPEIFLLLKPGHYDILVPRDEIVGKLLDPDSGPDCSKVAAAHEAVVGPGIPQSEDAGQLRRQSDIRWRSVMRLARDICGGFSAVLQCLEEKLVEELGSKKKRLGSTDESLFEGTLTSVLEPLCEALKRFQCVPDDSAFSEERRVPPDVAATQELLPLLKKFFHGGVAHAVSPMPRAGGVQATPAAVKSSVSPSIPVEVHVRKSAPAPVMAAAPPLTQASYGAAGMLDKQQHECCICMQHGATAIARCGCAYHPQCLAEYAQMEGQAASEVCCHLHNRALGADFLTQFAVAALKPPPTIVANQLPKDEKNIIPGSVVAMGPAVRQPMECIVESAPLMREAVNEVGYYIPDVSGLPASPSGVAARRVPPSSRRLMPTTGNLGAALGVPCVICFGEEGVLKTLHCGYKAHVDCLKQFWSQKVVTLCRLTNIRCPAEVTGCTADLGEEDLRGVVDAADVREAERSVRDVDEQNRRLIADLKRQSEEYRPMFLCAICLVEHEVEGCCTLPCQHRFCFESLQYHFDIIVRERRLKKLICPAEGCGCNLRSEESIHIFRQCLSEETYHKLHEFLTRDNPHIYECKRLGCEERVFLDDGDDFADLACPRGHRFCAKCNLGPHPGVSCDEREEQVEKERKEEEVKRDQEEAWRSAIALGWKPCPRRCSFGGGFKAAEECDHVTCECGFEFCWDCGVERQVALLHDNRWHKPSCRYHTRPEEVAEAPVFMQGCPECQRRGDGLPCSFPLDDGYPHSYMHRRSMRHPRR